MEMPLLNNQSLGHSLTTANGTAYWVSVSEGEWTEIANSQVGSPPHDHGQSVLNKYMKQKVSLF